MFDNAERMAKQTFQIAGVAVIELREISPHHTFGTVLAGSVGDAPVALAHEPIRMFARER